MCGRGVRRFFMSTDGFQYERSSLWQASLGRRKSDPDSRARELLRSAFVGFRDRCAVLAADVATALPNYTVHDITHIDALWEIADIVAGEDIELNALEGFILGGAFLLHDLGMAAAAYSNRATIRESVPDLWLEGELRIGVQGKKPNELTAIEQRAVEEFVLRVNHARKAEELASQIWVDQRSGESYRLIDNADLRFQFAPLIGKLAHSHWWSVRRIETEFSETYGAPAGWPKDWSIDALKLAVLVRAADAAHLDARRAPVFIRLTRQISAPSDDHWVFQQHLTRPTRDNGRLRYTSIHKFTSAESLAWWLCFDLLRMVDGELGAIDDLLSNKRSGLRLSVQGVAGASDPRALARYIPTDDWVPIDARPQITEVPKIIRSLGGAGLYGRDVSVPFREMIQNGIDAIQVLKAIVPGEFKSAGIEVSEHIDANGSHVVTFADQGVGMSVAAITKGLLDFGATYWTSDAAREDIPAPIGKRPLVSSRFGIGFYSLFLLGESVRVITRRYDSPPSDTLVLEFRRGLDERPLLRRARPAEQKWNPGTSIHVVLKDDVLASLYSHLGYGRRWNNVADVCRTVAPFSIVPLIARNSDGSVNQVSDGRRIEELSAEEILRRCCEDEADFEKARFLVPNLRVIARDERAVAYAALVPRYLGVRETGCEISEIGIRIRSLSAIAGYFQSSVSRALRDQGRVIASYSEVKKWAEDQYVILRKSGLKGWEQQRCWALLRELAVAAPDFPVVSTDRGYLTATEIEAYVGDKDFVVILSYRDFNYLDRADDPAVLDCPILVLHDGDVPGIRLSSDLPDAGELARYAVARAWGLSVADLEQADFGLGHEIDAVRVGTRDVSGLEVFAENGFVIFRNYSALKGRLQESR